MEHNKEKMTPKFFFLSAGVLITLITTVVAFLNLVFEALNKQFPDALNAVYRYGYSSWDYNSIRTSIATLIIVLPVFMAISYFWKKSIDGNQGKIDEIIKKWMLYLIVFLVGIILVVDLVTLVNYFVSGEITTRFILKVLVVLATAKVIGAYYLVELGVFKKWKNLIVKSSMTIGPLLVLVAVVLSFTIIGSPKDQRAWRLDQRRTDDLQSIQWQVISYWQQKEKLPEQLSELSNPISGSVVPVDPEFEKGLTYAYEKKTDLTFELCATFSAPMQHGWQEYGGRGVMPLPAIDMMETSVTYPGEFGGDSWDHEEGETCFERTIDKEIYPPYSKMK
ncbi:hypothetical protein GW765_03330 [Candidatus Parcubacteria bacterium]|nr:hypothetical protein [Candidatus Parcubacteria bacterium]